MTRPIWLTTAGFLGTVTQRTAESIPVTVQGTDIQFSVISGQLPSGMVLQKVTTGTSTSTTCFITGDPTSVPDVMTSTFAIRAKNSGGTVDRTFSIDTEGPVVPLWVTEEGMLPLGTTGEYFTVNQQLVDYQFVAEANVLTSDQKMRYYIGDGDGQLPPGLTLSEDGRMLGVVTENLTIDAPSYILGYDSSFYDAYPYDIVSPASGISTTPKFYTKIYRFRVTATDGFNSEKRLFSVQIFDANSLRADTSYIRADASFYANSGYLFAPIWLSPANLGSRRSANYQIINLITYDPFPAVGPVSYTWDDISINPEIRCLADSPANQYGAQIQNRADDNILYLKQITSLPQVGHFIRLDTYIEEADATEYEISSVTDTGNDTCYLTLRYNPRIVGDVVIYDTKLKVDILNETDFEYKFVSAIEKDNIYGVQYHPEKSHDVGELLLKNFIDL